MTRWKIWNSVLDDYEYLPGGSGGGGSYAAGTDRLVARISGMVVPAGTSVALDWTGASKFQAGTAIAVVADQIVFVEDGCYSVEVHIPGGVNDDTGPGVTVEARLKLPLSGTEWSDGADSQQLGGLTEGILSAKYIWCHNAGDNLQYARIEVPGAVDGTIGAIFAQIVRLSEVPAGNEFA